MVSTVNMTDAEAKARELLDGRIKSVRELVSTRQRITDIRADLAAAEAEDARAYQAALSDGWSADELKRLGLGEPPKKPRARRRTTSTMASRPATDSEPASAAPPAAESR